MANAKKVSDGKGIAALDATLRRLHLDGGADSIAMTVSRYLEEHGRDLLPSRDRAGWTAAEHEALVSVGVDPDQEPSGKAVVDAAARYAAILETALPIAIAARRLGVDPSRLRQRIRERTLIAVKGSDGGWLIPGFQFTDGGELPGLRVVAREIRPDATIISIVSFFTSPQPDLEGEDGEAMTPIAWLSSGRDPIIVRALASDI